MHIYTVLKGKNQVVNSRGGGCGRRLLVSCVPMLEPRTVKVTLNSVLDILNTGMIPVSTVFSQKVTENYCNSLILSFWTVRSQGPGFISF